MQTIFAGCTLSALVAVASAVTSYSPYNNQPGSSYSSSSSGSSYAGPPNPGYYPNNDYILDARRNAGSVFGGAPFGSPYGAPYSPMTSGTYGPPPPYGPPSRSGAIYADGNPTPYSPNSPLDKFFGPPSVLSGNGPSGRTLYPESVSGPVYGSPSPYDPPQLSSPYNGPSEQSYSPSSSPVSGYVTSPQQQQQPTYSSPSSSSSVSGYVTSPQQQQQQPQQQQQQQSTYTVGNNPSNDNANTANNVLSLLHTSVPAGTSYDASNGQPTSDQSNNNAPDNTYTPQQPQQPQQPSNVNYGPSASSASDGGTSSQNTYSSGPSSSSSYSSSNSGPSVSSQPRPDASGYDPVSQRYVSGAPNSF